MSEGFAVPVIIESKSVPTVALRRTVPDRKVRTFLNTAFDLVEEAVRSSGGEVGAPFCLYHGAPGDLVDMEIGYVVPGGLTVCGEVFNGSLPAARVARITHAGGFKDRGDSWDVIMAWMERESLTPDWETMWEYYSPRPLPSADPERCDLHWPLR